MKKLTLYSCTQKQLYATARLSWNFCLSDILKFQEMKQKYTPDYVDDMLAAITAAEALPADKARIGNRSALRVLLVRSTAQALIQWQFLKSYIMDAYPADMLHAKLEAAGISFYTKASAANWSAVKDLLGAGVQFIADNRPELEANNNMPSTFGASYTNLVNEWEVNSQNYFNSDATKLIGTGDKIAANNAVYQSLISMCKDGQQIFRSNEEKKKQFTFEQLVKMAGKGGVSGINGIFLSSATNASLDGVVITEATGKYSAVTDSAGRFRITKMAAGAYEFTFARPGYYPVTKTITLDAGRSKRITQSLAQEVALTIAA